jgi:hypothetical protein
MPLDPVKFPGRPRIRLRVLPAHRQTHRVPLADITPDHPLVPNILAHLALQVSFYPQPAQRVHALRFDSREGRGWRVDLREVRPCAWQILEGRRGGRRPEGEGGQRRAWGYRGGGGGRKECGYGCHLGCGELADAAGVVDL